ncbi:unnamed protein product [Pelagomonas calceolata]|uniref:Uncharacterized protein n=1 Tax=Pelagomonas calceolata TaxID=35677 RepID=A0A7S4A5L0_9STRA|nr:unnamed protein product [Pelagomonas calceolata]|mmetsp:Transcript_2296/g.6410  ORF Transcript_2296/g.6410 Transcript_2296/m.6410 type:complete len:224 (+) Transcript_2296:158-829(+)
MRRSYAAALCVQLATALFAGHPSKIPVKPVNVAIEPPPTTLGGPAAPRAKQNLAEEWNLADRVRAASVPSPTDGRRHVAWRRLARQSGDAAETLRARWAACGHHGSPVLPLLEPWEIQDGLVRGAADGEAVQLALAVGGGDELLLGAGVVETASGAAYELGAPSDSQIEAWRRPDIALPVVDAPQMGWVQGAAGMVAAPTALAALVVAAGVLTHHLQVHVFVI